MKKAGKITLLIILSVGLLIGIFHGNIIRYALKKVFSERSQGTISLNIDEFHFSLLTGDISILRPVVQFKELYLNKNKSIKVEEIAFREVRIEKLDLLKLIFEQEIDAKRFFVDKPEFYFIEHGTINKSDFQPKGFLEALKHEDDSFSGFYINIDEVEIHYGTITFSANTDIDINPGQVDFTINLEKFSTHHDSAGANRVLYSDNFRFKLAGVHKVIKSDYDLRVDSVTFSSVHRDFVISGISIIPLDKLRDENTIAFKAGRLSFNDIGIDELQTVRDLNFGSVEVERAELINHVNKKNKSGKEPVGSDGIHRFLNVLHSLSIDTLAVDEFDFLQIEEWKDTVIYADDINLMFTELYLDSAMYSDIAKKIGFDEVSVNTRSVRFNNPASGISLSYDDLSYANVDNELEVYGLDIRSNTEKLDVELKVPECRIFGLSAHEFQGSLKQSVSVYVDDPVGKVVFKDGGKDTASTGQQIVLPLNLYLYEFVIKNGNVELVRDEVFNVVSEDLNLYAGGVMLPSDASDTLGVNSFRFSTGSTSVHLMKADIEAGMSGVNYSDNDLSVMDIDLIRKKDTIENRFTIDSLVFAGIDKNRLLYSKELHTDTLLLSKPEFNGVVFQRNKKEEQAAVASFSFDVGCVMIRNGKVDVDMRMNDDISGIEAQYNVTTGQLKLSEGDSLKQLLDSLKWQFDIDSLNTTAYGHQLFAGNITGSTTDSLFKVSDIRIKGDDNVFNEHPEFVIRDLDLPYLKFSGLDYGRLIQSDTLLFSALNIRSPRVDVVIKKEKQRSGVSVADTNTGTFPVLIYDTIKISDVSVGLSRRGKGINKKIDIRGLNVAHYNNRSGTGNLIKDLMFKVGELRMYDSISHKSLVIDGVDIDTAKCSMLVRGVSSGKHLNDEEMQAGTKFYSKGIVFSGINIKESLPVDISASRLNVDKVDVFVTGDTVRNEDRKVFSLRLKGLNDYKKVFASFRVDTAFLTDINFRIHTLGNLPDKTGKLDSISLMIEGIKIDSSMAGKSNPDIMDRIHIDLNGKTNVTADSLYEMKPGILHYSFLSQKITVDSLYVTPLFEPDDFFRRAKYQTDRIDLFVKKIEIRDIGFDDLMEDNVMDISGVDFVNVKADMYRDKRFPLKPNSFKPMPGEMLLSLKRTFNIDSLRVLDSFLRYREMGEKSTDPGEVFFDNVNIQAYNLTNVISENEKKDLNVTFKGKIMGKAGMQMNVSFPLNDDSIAFRLTGKTEKMDMAILNPLTTNLLGIGIIKGRGRVDVDNIAGTDDVSTGTLIFRYKTLRVHPYSRKKEKLKKGPLSPLIKFMINDLVVKSNNPKFARKPRVGQVYFERDNRKGVINYIWKSVLSGLMSTMGFNTKQQRKEKKENKAAARQTAALPAKGIVITETQSVN